MKCKAKKAFFAGKNDIYHRWKEVKKLNGKAKTSITTENRSGSAADAAAKEKRTEMPPF